MANNQSSKKDIRRTATRTERNRAATSRIKTLAKKLGGSYGAVCLTGGLCQTEYLPDAIAEKLGAPVLTHPQGRFAGAIGAALAARRLSR